MRIGGDLDRELGSIFVRDRTEADALLAALDIRRGTTVRYRAMASLVHIAADGISATSLLRSRFVPWSDVVSISQAGSEILLALEGGRSARMPAGRQGVGQAMEALRRHRASDVPKAANRLARSGDAPAEWRARLLDREGSFRDAPLRGDDLWNVLESPGASRSARTAAAAVLARDASPDDRVRIRVAADTCAEPRLRVVLDRAAEGTSADELLTELDSVDDEGTTGTRARSRRS